MSAASAFARVNPFPQILFRNVLDYLLRVCHILIEHKRCMMLESKQIRVLKTQVNQFDDVFLVVVGIVIVTTIDVCLEQLFA